MVLSATEDSLLLRRRSHFESTLFRLPTKRGLILILVYVDDLLFAAQDQSRRRFFVCLDAAWLNEGRCPGGRPSVS